MIFGNRDNKKKQKHNDIYIWSEGLFMDNMDSLFYIIMAKWVKVLVNISISK